MGMLDWLPSVENCCFCISLKWGAFIIAVLSILSFGVSAYSSYSRPCLKSDLMTKISHYFGYVALFIQVVVLIASIVLIIGVFTSKPEIGIWYAYAALAAVIVFLAFFILSLVAGITNKNCKFPLIDVIATAVNTFISLYFIIVVKSFSGGD